MITGRTIKENRRLWQIEALDHAWGKLQISIRSAPVFSTRSNVRWGTSASFSKPRSPVQDLACELPLQRRLIEYLGGRDVRLIGPGHGEEGRVGTISFVHAAKSSREIAAAAHARQIGIRHGHMYAYRLCARAGIEPEDGVVRVSLVHYNTSEEIERLIDVLETVL